MTVAKDDREEAVSVSSLVLAAALVTAFAIAVATVVVAVAVAVVAAAASTVGSADDLGPVAVAGLVDFAAVA